MGRKNVREELVEREEAEPAVLARSQEAGAVSESEERAPVGGGDLSVVRELILRAHPDVVPELVQGGSVAELVASVEGARAAYQAVAERVQERKGAGKTPALQGKGAGETPAVPEPPKVPAGGGAAVVNVDDLPTAEKIKRGIASSRQPSGGR
jgi:hypothetical protein